MCRRQHWLAGPVLSACGVLQSWRVPSRSLTTTAPLHHCTSEPPHCCRHVSVSTHNRSEVLTTSLVIASSLTLDMHRTPPTSAGVSVSTLTRSEVALDPTDVTEAKDLEAWWAAQGSSAAIEPLGQAGSSQGGSQGSGGQRQVRKRPWPVLQGDTLPACLMRPLPYHPWPAA